MCACPPPPASPAAGVKKVVVKTTLAGWGAALADGLDAAEQRRLAEALRSRLTSATTDVEVAEVLYTVTTVVTIGGLALDPAAETRRRLEQAYAASVALPVDRVELGRVAPHDEAAGNWFQIGTGRRLAAAAVVDVEFVIRTSAAAEVGLATAAARRGTAALVLAKQLSVAGLGPAVKVEAVAAEAEVEAAVAFAVVTAVDAEAQVGALLRGATGLGADLAAAVGGDVRAVGPVEVAEPRRDGPGAEAPPAPEARPGEGEGGGGGGGLRARRALPLVGAAAGAVVVLGAAGWARRRWRRRQELREDAAIPDAG